MLETLKALSDVARQAAPNGCMEDASIILTEKVDQIVREVSPYVADYLKSSGSRETNIAVRTSTVMDLFLAGENKRINDPVDAGMYREVITYLIAKEAFPLEKVCLKSVLFADSENSPYAGMTELEAPSTYNYVLCYVGDSYYNDFSYREGQVFLEGSVLRLEEDRLRFRREHGLSGKK